MSGQPGIQSPSANSSVDLPLGNRCLLGSMGGSDPIPLFWVGHLTQARPISMFYSLLAKKIGSGKSIQPKRYNEGQAGETRPRTIEREALSFC